MLAFINIISSFFISGLWIFLSFLHLADVSCPCFLPHPNSLHCACAYAIIRLYLYSKGVSADVCYGNAQHPRTYRRFAQKPVPQDVVDDMVEALRLSSCGANRQAVKLVVVQSPEMVKKVHPLVKWAGYLPPEQGAPKADEQPVMYLAVVQDSSIPGDLNTDTGIALANITLAAWAKGVGSCIMGAINKPALSELLGIAAPDKLAFMVALGCPTHAARVVPMTEKTGIKYYLDENGDYCVPKRSVEELARTV